jgi:E1A/CREB-binding protein
MKVSLMQWSNDGSEPFSGSQMFSQNVVDIDKDELYYELFKETNDPQLDSFTQIALELLSAQFLIILERKASTQLPGGVYWTPSQYTEEMTSNVPKTCSKKAKKEKTDETKLNNTISISREISKYGGVWCK